MPQVRVAMRVANLSVVVHRRGGKMVRSKEHLLAISHCRSKNDGVVSTGYHSTVLCSSSGNWRIDLDERICSRVDLLIATD